MNSITGDKRTNQIISLTALHILFAREHNRIADILAQLNPRWSDEVIFLETQRIVTAEVQHIAYNEWVPNVIGSDTVQKFGIGLHNGYSDDYNPNVNPAITSEFSTAAQRFGHSIVDGKFLYVKCNFSIFYLIRMFFISFLIFPIYSVDRVDDIVEKIDIPDVMFNSHRLRQRGFYDGILIAMTKQPLQQVDSAVTRGVS